MEGEGAGNGAGNSRRWCSVRWLELRIQRCYCWYIRMLLLVSRYTDATAGIYGCYCWYIRMLLRVYTDATAGILWLVNPQPSLVCFAMLHHGGALEPATSEVHGARCCTMHRGTSRTRLCSHRRHEATRRGRPAIQAYGMQAYGIQAYGIQAYGMQAYGMQAYGIQAYGMQAYGIQAYGRK